MHPATQGGDRDGVDAEVATVASDKWGVEIVAVDVQDVFIQDAAIFAAMQAGFRAEKDREAKLANLDAQRVVETHRLESERTLEKTRQELALEKAARDAEVELTRLEHLRRHDEEASKRERRRSEQADTLAAEKSTREAERLRSAAEAERERAQIAAEAKRIEADEATRALRERLAAESTAGEASMQRLYLTEAVPQIASLLSAGLTNARVHLYQGGRERARAARFERGPRRGSAGK